MKYIFVTGGVVSSLGKGILTSSLGAILRGRGYRVTAIKIDPYVNVDAGTMRPYEHGEVFVTGDGAETDLDIGHYERFLDIDLSRANNLTTGQVYLSVIQKERRGEYLSQTVQVIPHITDEIKDRIRRTAHEQNAEIVVVEVGGTVGDIESLPFLEAIRQFQFDEEDQDLMYLHLTLVPYLAASEEFKTKPTQHSVSTLRGVGIQPDVLVLRSEKLVPEEVRKKVALFTNVHAGEVFSSPTVQYLYEMPLVLEEQGLGRVVEKKLGLEPIQPNLSFWQNAVRWAATNRLTVRKEGIDLRTDEQRYTLGRQVLVTCDLIGAEDLYAQIKSRQQEDIDRLLKESPDPTLKDRTARVIDLVAPIGKGQRALIVARDYGDRALEGSVVGNAALQDWREGRTDVASARLVRIVGDVRRQRLTPDLDHLDVQPSCPDLVPTSLAAARRPGAADDPFSETRP